MTGGEQLLIGGPARRAVLIGAAAGLTGLLVGGCTGHPAGRGTARPPSADELAAGRAAQRARELIGQESAAGWPAPVAGVIGQLVADHRSHLAALGLPEPSPSGSPAASSTDGARGSATAPVPGGTRPAASAASPGALVAAERAAAVEALGDVVTTSAATAGLLARIAACRAVHADLVSAAASLPEPGELAPAGTGTPSPGAPSTATPSSGTPSTSPSLGSGDAAALSLLVRGEHAAVFAYGLITARAPRARQEAARQLWQAHRSRRDALEQQLIDAGQRPPVAEPAYDVGPPPTTPDQLSQLAARVENGLATAALSAVVAGSAAVRGEAALELVTAARRAAGWQGHGTALPG